jgi:N-acetylglutamate synthase-like GNAT family acetyltransferase
MEIVYLADQPGYLPTVARWVFDEWGRKTSGVTLAQIKAKFRGHLQRDAVPLTLVAVEDERPIGTASIFLQDLSIRPDLSPWLAAVYVPPKQRRQGIGGQLVQAAEKAARRLEIERLYLFTPDQVPFYTRLGWSILEETDLRSQSITIMSKTFSNHVEP